MIASIRIGVDGSIVPVGVNRSSQDRCPHWNTHTITPNVAVSDSTFITIAFTGSTTEPNARNSSRNVAPAITRAIHGSTDDRLDSSSASWAVWPPISACAPAGGVTARASRTISRAAPDIGLTL